MGSRRRACWSVAVGAAVFLVLGAAASPAVAVSGASTVLVSVSSAGVQGNDLSEAAVIAAGGRYLAFSSHSTNLAPGDDNHREDAFVRDLQSSATTLVSVSSTGVRGNGSSVVSSVSGNGRFVAFYSDASNLVDDDTNGETDAFVRDRWNATTTRVSVSGSGVQGDRQSLLPRLSEDGRYVVFQSAATNLVAGDTNGALDVFVRDRQAGTTRRVSVTSTGAQGNRRSYDAFISATGRYVSFTSGATNLVPGDTNRARDVFVRDRTAGTTSRVSLSSAGAQGFAASDAGPISSDGRYVAFSSLAQRLVPGDSNGVFDAFVRDRTAGTTRRVSVSSGGVQGNSDSFVSSASADFRYVTFQSSATNLVLGDINGTYDVFVRDRLNGTTERVSVSSGGAESNGFNSRGTMSADGRYVVFASFADNLVSGDTNNTQDAFLHDRGAPL